MSKTNEIMDSIEADRRRHRREALMRRVLDGLRQTVRVRPMGDSEQSPMCAEFTDESARFIAPLIEAVDILEAIIWASDGCMGHRHCAHSMEPWQRARALLRGKWEAESGERSTWPEGPWRE